MSSLPNVVFLPGLMDDHSMWARQIDGLSDVANCLALDLVDHDDVSESAEWVLKQSPEKFALVGFSMGGYVAFEILRRAPDRITKLALVSTSARADTPERRDERLAMISRAEEGDYGALVDELIPRVLHPENPELAFLISAIRDMALGIGPAAFVRQLNLIMSRPDSRDILSQVTCPSLVVCGLDDVVTPPEVSREMAEGIPGAELKLIDHCNHYSSMEQPEIVNSALRRWLTD